MSRGEKLTRWFGWLIVLAIAIGPVRVTVAEDPPKDEAKTTAQKADAPPAGSLAAAAATIRLKKPEGEESGALVISDQNVKTAGEGAVVSQGSGATVVSSGPAPAAASHSASAVAANAAASELQAQRIKVQNMAEQLANYDRQLSEPGPDPHYPKYSDAPQFRSPGIVDPAQGKRDQLALQLEQERAKLAELEKKAKRAGVEEAKPAPAPTPSPN